MSSLLAVVGFYLVAQWFALVRQKEALNLVVALSPWTGLEADIGLRVTAFQIALVALLVSTFVRKPRGAGPAAGDASSPFLFFVGFAVCWSLSRIPFLPDVEVGGGLLRSPELRAFSQLLMFLLTVSPVIAVVRIAEVPLDILGMAKAYLLSLLLLAIVGLVQIVVWYATGSNPIPVGWVMSLLGAESDLRGGAYEFNGIEIFRMNSLGGEPKNLGGALVLGMLMLQTLLSTAKVAATRKLVLFWLFLAASAIATMATTAFLLWLLGTAAIAVARALSRVHYEVRIGSGIQIAASLTFAFLMLGAIALAAGLPLYDLIMDRTVVRLSESESGIFEDFDFAIRQFLIDNPISLIAGVGLGNVHLYADEYLPPIVAEYAASTVFTAKAQYLRFISEIGIVGFSLFSLWSLQLIKTADDRLSRSAAAPWLNALVPFGLVNLMTFLAAGATAAQYFLGAGALASTYRVLAMNARDGSPKSSPRSMIQRWPS